MWRVKLCLPMQSPGRHLTPDRCGARQISITPDAAYAFIMLQTDGTYGAPYPSATLVVTSSTKASLSQAGVGTLMCCSLSVLSTSC